MVRIPCLKSRWTRPGDGIWVFWSCDVVFDTLDVVAGACGWGVPMRGGVGAGGARAAAGTVGMRVCAAGPSVVTDVGNAVAAAGLIFVEGEGTAPEDA